MMLMALQTVEKNPRAKLIEDIRSLDSISDRKIDVMPQLDGQYIDVEIGFPPVRKKPKKHFFERQKEFLPGITLDFNEKTAAASVTLRYPIGVSQGSKKPWVVSGATFPAVGKVGNVKQREDEAAEFGKNALNSMGWVAQKALESVEKEPRLAKSELFLSRVSSELRGYAEGVRGKEFERDFARKLVRKERLEPLAPEMDASKKTLHVQLVDRYDEPQLLLRFTRNFTSGRIFAEYNVRLMQNEDGSFTAVKRDLSDAAIELQEGQAVKFAQRVMGEIQKIARGYFEALEKGS